MKHLRFIAVIAVVAFCASWQARASDVKVIANNSVTATSISAGDLKDVFLLDKDSLGGSHVEPVLQNSGAAHEAFLKEYVGKSNAVLQAFYRSLVFTGKASMPKVTAADAEAVAYVAKTKGAVGYVSSGASTEGVKTLQVK
ncbi:MAG: hypothetical protein ABSG96_24620 [Terracidiphilus sp.]|jgi:hypothetical protein